MEGEKGPQGLWIAPLPTQKEKSEVRIYNPFSAFSLQLAFCSKLVK